MKSQSFCYRTLVLLLLLAGARAAAATPITGYTVATSTGASIVPGDTDVGNHCDDCMTTNIALPFPVMFYDQVFAAFGVSSDGHLTFTSADDTDYNFCLPHAISYLIVPASADLYTIGNNSDNGNQPNGIFTSVSGSAPNRIFNIEWRASYCCGESSGFANFEIRLYEGQQRIDFIYGTVSGYLNGIGVQRDTGSSQYTLAAPCGAVPAAGTQYTFTIPKICADVPPNMIAWWRGDGNADDSVLGHNGSLMAGATFAAGEVNQGFSFDGVAAHVIVPSPAGNFGSSDFTIDFWMKTAFAGDVEEIINKRRCGGNNDHSFDVQLQGGDISFQLIRANDSTNTKLLSNGLFNDGNFHHIVLVRSGTTMSIYADGVLNNSLTNSDVANTSIDNSAPLGIGGAGCADPNSGDGTKTFNGIIDEVEMFDRALSPAEIASIYNAGPLGKCECTTPPQNMISWWPAEGSTTDIKGSNNLSDGTGNGVSYGAGEVGQAFTFNTSQFLTAGTPASLALSGTQVTIDGWINPTQATKSGVYFGTANSGQNDYALFLLGDLTGCVKTDQEYFVHTGFVPPAGQWTHIAMTYDGTNEIVYANGIELARQAVSGNIVSEGVPFFIGGRQGDNPPDALYINAAIDEVEVFDRGLRADEIAALYNAGSAGKCGCKIELTPEIPLTDFGSDGNDGYGNGRGTVFQANEGITITGAGLWINPSGNDTFTYNLWEVTTYPGGVNNTLLATASGTLSDIGLAFYDIYFDNPVQLTPGHKYHIEVLFDGALQQEFFYVFDQSSNAPVNIGPVTVLDGTSGGNTLNTVMPFIRLTTDCTTSAPAQRQLANISTRASVGTGDDVAIGGFIIKNDSTGTTRGNRAAVATKEVLIRGLGPSLQVNNVPVPGRLADPYLELHDSNGALITFNDDWTDTQGPTIQATGLAPSDPKESAILAILNVGSGYTAILSGVGATTGIGLVEIYDLEKTTGYHLTNISTRGFVSTGNDVLIGGLIIEGVDSSPVVVRAIGPSLTAHNVAGALDDPVLELHDGNGALIETNDDWASSPEAVAITASGLAPTDSRESAILFTPAPGGYTAIVSGKNPNPTGVALVEAYRLTTP